LPLISRLLDWGYAVFARNRIRLTGRCMAKNCSAKPDSVPVRSPGKESA